MKRRLTLGTSLAILACAVFSVSVAFADHAKLGAKAPDFTLKDQNGKEVKLADYKGKAVVLEWLNPDCPYVKRHYEAGTMTSLAKEYAKSDVVWLAISSNAGATAEDM